MHDMPVWLQILVGFGGFTLLNILSTAVLWGKMQQTLKEHASDILDMKEQLNPKDSDCRFLTVKDCVGKQSIIISTLQEIKGMIRELDKNHGERMTRIEGRREDLIKLVCTLSGRVSSIETDEGGGR